MNTIKTYRSEILVFLAVFIPRVLYSIVVSFHSGSHGFISFSDAEMFVHQANNLLEHGVMSRFSEPPYLPDPLRTPLYIWFLAALLWLKVSFFGMVTIQNILAAVSGVLVYRIGKTHLNSSRAGFLAALLFGVEPMSIYWNNLLMSDDLFAFLFIVTVYLFLEKRWYLGAAALGIATLTKPVALYYLPIFLIFAVVTLYSRGDVRSVITKGLLIVVIFTAVLFPWMIHNKVVFNRWELSTAGWLNLYLFSLTEFASRKGIELPLPSAPDGYHSSVQRDIFYRYEFESADFYREKFRGLISEYPFSYLAFHLGSGIMSMNNHDYEYLLNHVARPELPQVNLDAWHFVVVLGQGLWLVVYAFSLIGLFVGDNTRVKLFLVALFVFNNLLIGYNGVISSGGRYNLAFVPLILLVGAFGFAESVKKIRHPIDREGENERVDGHSKPRIDRESDRNRGYGKVKDDEQDKDTFGALFRHANITDDADNKTESNQDPDNPSENH